MLTNSRVEANIPASDLNRARAFYADTLGLEVADEMEGAEVSFMTATGSRFHVYETQYAGQAGHTIAQWHVDDIEAEVRDLKARGVTFEHYDLPGTTWDGDIATLKGFGRGAWFRDSEGNIMCVDQLEGSR